jgi:hypothetical protein
MLTSRSMTVLVLALALALLSSGCGGSGDGSDDSSGISTSSIGKSEFVDQANAICKKGKKELLRDIVEYQKKNINEFSVKVVSGAARKVIKPDLEAQIAKMSELGAPEGDAEEIQRFFTSLLRGVDEIAAEKPPTFEEAEPKLQDAGDTARRYGIDECEYELVDEAFTRRVLNEEE